jgi:hypothetical protein
MNMLRLLAALLVFLLSSAGAKQVETARLSALNQDEQIDCGIAFYLRGASLKGEEQEQVFNYYDERDVAHIRINGELHSLRQTNSRPGYIGFETWSDDAVVVTLRYDAKKDSDESLATKGTMTVKVGRSRRTYMVQGYVGC